MSQETESKPDVEGFINKHLVKVLWAVVVYFLMNLSTDFKDVKITLQQLLINQATTDSRMIRLEKNDELQDKRITEREQAWPEFYKTYKLTKRTDD